MSVYPDDFAQELLASTRASKGVMAKILGKTLPPDPKAMYVWPELAHIAAKTPKGDETPKSVLRFLPLAFLLLVCTICLIALLLQVPFLDYSVVGILSKGFGLFLPNGWATGVAWTIGIVGVVSLGGYFQHTPLQSALDKRKASKNSFYNFWLRFALWEEMVFRAGAERWTIRQRITASTMFGAIHITNIWYSLAAGIALSLTGFGFMLVYLWASRRYRNQIIATSYAAVVHALYNILAIGLLLIALLSLLLV